MVRYFVQGLRYDAIFKANNKKDAKKMYHDMYGFDIIYNVKEF